MLAIWIERGPCRPVRNLLSDKQNMDLDRLTEILDWMARSPLSELEVTDGAFRVHLVGSRDGQLVDAVAASPAAPRGHDVLAPTYGVVHLSPDAASPIFVEVGQAVSAGQPLCIIEAMKVFSTIEAEAPGTVAEILVAQGAEVAAGQPLFRME
jgi:acetyl-CoA carboxylase biotin carboxyl carrier protein